MTCPVYFIKLGPSGEWEQECLTEGKLRFGYHETPHKACLDGEWDYVYSVWYKKRGDRGTATRDLRQIQKFYTAPEDAIFITFSAGLLYWCNPVFGVEELSDGSRQRLTVDGWHCTSRGGKLLTADKLSGHLLRVQGYRGTICDVSAADYLLRKISDISLPEAVAADEAEAAFICAIQGLLRRLTWQDFELLVELVFSASGWRRLSPVGRTQRMVDIELVLPSTGDRAFVQIKSEASLPSVYEYVAKMGESQGFERMFFVWHTGAIDESSQISNVTLIGPSKLSHMVLDAGLARWLREKVF